jgi:uncharacterized protein YqgC (DUF456 family)
MLFNSIEFLIFFPIVTLLFFVLPINTGGFICWRPVAFSTCFLSPSNIFILLVTIVIDYVAAIWIAKPMGKSESAIW